MASTLDGVPAGNGADGIRDLLDQAGYPETPVRRRRDGMPSDGNGRARDDAHADTQTDHQTGPGDPTDTRDRADSHRPSGPRHRNGQTAGRETRTPRWSRLLANPGRRIRVLSGVDEELLGRVPTERPHYTGMGGAVLGTAVIGAFSMLMAFGEILGHHSVLMFVPVLIWGLFVLNLDRWLVSITTGSQWVRRVRLLLPRLLVAVFFGVIIAEPLVLRIFQTAIEQHIQDGRDDQVRELRGHLVSCNPVPTTDQTGGGIAGGAGCAGFRLNLGSTPQGASAELAQAKSDLTTLQSQLKQDALTRQRLDDLAVNECAGHSGPGLTGVAGVGTECRNRRDAADAFRTAHPAGEGQDQITQLRTRIKNLEPTVAESTAAFEQRRSDAVEQKVAKLRSNQGRIGLLERFHALDDLVGNDVSLRIKRWAIRLFLIVIDCVPVLVKLAAGTTAYDRLVEAEKDGAIRIHREETLSAERIRLAEIEVAEHEAASRSRRRRDEMDLQERDHLASVHKRRNDMVGALAAELHRQATAATR